MKHRTQPQFYSEKEWQKERESTDWGLLGRAFLVIVLFFLLLVLSTFIRIKMEDQETEEVEVMERIAE